MKADTLPKILLFYGPLSLLFAFWLVPWTSRLHQLQNDIDRMRAEKRKRDLLRPFYDDLRDRAKASLGRELNIPNHRALPSAELPQLESLFREPASALGLELIRCDAKVEDLRGDYGQLQVELGLTGPLPKARDYLLRMCQLPELARLSSVGIRRLPDGGGTVLVLALSIYVE